MRNKINVIPWALKNTWVKLDSMKEWDKHKGRKELRIIINGRYAGSVDRYSKPRIDKIIEDNLP